MRVLGREGEQGREKEVGVKAAKLNCNFRAVTVLRAGNSAAVPVSGGTRLPLRAETDLIRRCAAGLNCHSSQIKRTN